VTEYLYGVTQSSTRSISNAGNSVCPSSCGLDDNTASISGSLTSPSTVWTWTNLQDTGLTTIVSAQLDVRFRQSNWSNDTFALEYSVDDWDTAHELATYQSANPPPGSLTTATFADLESVISTPALADAVQVRFRGGARGGSSNDNITLRVDQVRLVLRGWP
jgi:hypothetical protein